MMIITITIRLIRLIGCALARFAFYDPVRSNTDRVRERLSGLFGSAGSQEAVVAEKKGAFVSSRGGAESADAQGIMKCLLVPLLFLLLLQRLLLLLLLLWWCY